MVTKDMTFAKAMKMHPDVVQVLGNYQLGCISCMGAQNETLEEGCLAHGINVDELLAEINALF